MPTKNADKFECKECHFICRKQSNYIKHLVTAKHKNLTNSDNDNKNAKLFDCVLCSKQYFSRVGLWKHMKICDYTTTVMELSSEKDENEEKTIKIDNLSNILNKDEILLKLIKDNDENN